MQSQLLRDIKIAYTQLRPDEQEVFILWCLEQEIKNTRQRLEKTTT